MTDTRGVPASGGGRDRIAQLVRAIHDAERELESLAGAELDAIVSGTGEPYLLRAAQSQLVRSREEAVRVSETLEVILEAMQAHVALVDASGKIRAVNGAWRAFVEQLVHELPNHAVGVDYLSVLNGISATTGGNTSEIGELLLEVLAGRLPIAQVEFSVTAADRNRSFLVEIAPIREGSFGGAVVLHFDISARREAETALRRAEEQRRADRDLQDIAEEYGRIGGWRLEISDQKLVWSNQVCEIHGHPKGTEPTLEMAIAHYVPEHRPLISAAVSACINESRAFDLELQIRTMQGEVRWVRAIGRDVRDPTGDLVAIHGALQDIDELKRIERQFLRAQRLESVGTLAGGIAHDLNNVLTPILMSVDLLRMDEADRERLETLASIETSARRGADMVRQVLTFARGAEGQRVPVALASVVREIERMMRETFPKNITARLEIDSDIPIVLGDPTQLHQVMMNLVVNARDAMPTGGLLTVRLSSVMVDAEYAEKSADTATGRHVVIEVEDTGTGIPQDIIDRVFDPFFTTKEQGKGTGLGLSTSLAIAKSHGGFIRIYSEVHRGTKVRVCIPCALTEGRQEDAVASPTVQRGHGELILVVDDEPVIRNVTQRTLEAFGYRVLLAVDGADGLAVFAAHRETIRLVLTDIMMPVLDGNALIEVVHRMAPSMPIIAASGLHSSEQVKGHGDGSVRAFLPKPYTSEHLLLVIQRVLEGVAE